MFDENTITQTYMIAYYFVKSAEEALYNLELIWHSNKTKKNLLVRHTFCECLVKMYANIHKCDSFL